MTSNQTKVISIVSLISLTLMVAGYIIGDRQGLLIGLVFALGNAFLAYYYSERHWLEHFSAREIEGQDPWRLLETSKELAIKARITPPKIYVSMLGWPTVISLGRSSHQGKIIITQSLIEKLSETELRAVLAHEIVRIRRNETFFVSVLGGVLAPLFMAGEFADVCLLLITLGFSRKWRIFQRASYAVFFVLLTALIQKRQIFETDRQAGHLLQNPEQLARVLMKLEAFSRNHRVPQPPSVESLMLVSPMSEMPWTRSLPSVSERIEKLTGQYPI